MSWKSRTEGNKKSTKVIWLDTSSKNEPEMAGFKWKLSAIRTVLDVMMKIVNTET
jgi:hypothetical protein